MTHDSLPAEGSALAGNAPSSRRKVWSWAMWDWGTQPLNTVIITFVFSVYITGRAFGPENVTAQALALSTGIAGLIVALIAPVLGQRSDRTGRTVFNLRWQTWLIAALAAALFFVRPAPEYLWLGLGILGVASIVGELANVNYYSLIDEVSTKDNVGRVSGFGWGMGYLGGIVALLVLYFGFISPEVGLFGVTSADGMDIRASMIVCGVWILLFTIPTFLALKDRKRDRAPDRVGLVESYRLLGRSIQNLWRSSPHTVFFLAASALFRDGLSGVFAFGAVLASLTFGFSAGDVIIFGAVANIVAGVSTIGFGFLDDRIGPKKVILISLVALVLLGLGVFFLHDRGQVIFWTLGMAMTAFVGPAQSASRSFLARLIPEGKAGEIFGLYATTGRAISFLAPAAFGLAVGLGATITGESNTAYWGILGIVLILLAGLLVLIPVKDPAHHAVG
ncbi:MFS transporter [Propioniciclava sinopodophylli]|uniref:MFS transporter n=1 Tax=Propioniciclava sinopodophylli TaxID=1837344 RepID=UPI00249164DD|nr:MFS transporter [Propioniciclava sinopodophylli]